MDKGRTHNSINNTVIFLINNFVRIFLNFLIRAIIIKYLGKEFLGIDTLFSGILNILNLADLGISTTVIFLLYKPISENNENKIAVLMAYFNKFYIIIGFTILVLGISSTPFLKFLINLPDNVPNNINLLYIVYVCSISSTYFFSSRRILFEAEQKKRYIIIIDLIVFIVFQLLIILSLKIFKSYLFYIILKIIMIFVSNIIILTYSKFKYPYLNKYSDEKLSKLDKKEFFVNSGAIFMHKIGSLFVTGIDIILISYFLTTITAGYYGNYLLITNNLINIINMIMLSITPSIGNLKNSNNDIEYHYKIFKKIIFMNFWISTVISLCIFITIDDFILVWMGSNEFLLGLKINIIIVVNFFFSTTRFGVGAFLTAAGYFKKTIYKPIFEGLINLSISLISVHYIGLSGILIGTSASILLGSFWVDPYVTFKYWFKKNVQLYYRYFTKFLIIFIISTLLCYILCVKINTSNNLFDFIIKGSISFIFINAIIILFYFKSNEFKFYYNKFKSILNNISKRIKENL